MTLTNIIVAICSALFFMIGADKFFMFLEPPCSLTSSIPDMVWKIFGVMQISAGILIWIPKYRKYVAIFFTAFMLVFIIVHLLHNTYDIGGAAIMAILLGLLAWNPSFLSGERKNK